MHPTSTALISRRPRVRIRRMTPADAPALDQVVDGMSARSLRSRYLASMTALTPAMRSHLLDLDGSTHVAFVAETGRGAQRTAIGLARFVVDGPDRAEIAYEVVDAWHGRGVGTRLLRRLVREARGHGIACLHGTLLPENAGSIRLLCGVLPQTEFRRVGQEVEVVAWLVAPALDAGDLDLGTTSAGRPGLAVRANRPTFAALSPGG